MGARIEPNRNIPNRGRDERHFRQGEIWIIDDQQIAIPCCIRTEGEADQESSTLKSNERRNAVL